MSAEEETVPINVEETVTAPASEKKPAAKGGKAKKTKEVKAAAAPKKKPAASPPRKRTSSSHPTYEEMIKDAITTLKERTGSSQYAIQKFIEEKQKSLPPTFRKLLLVNLKRLVASGKLVKVKGSFKLPSAKSTAVAAPKPAPVKKKATVSTKPKAARTSSRTSPGKKAAAPAKKAAAAAKAPAAKSVKAKSPAKRASTRKVKK
ncbi:hypothetical protein DY000_02034855 [Brassica cretica]|uniref:H15 domain-containing protein n=1 Tax=Brassica cretica TaxID=69181 RepID=A0ABQ7DTS4_BRACR|nr:hypothetical protein DY000_02034855 [Brassica cretica]